MRIFQDIIRFLNLSTGIDPGCLLHPTNFSAISTVVEVSTGALSRFAE
jgi:hypothetical protein